MSMGRLSFLCLEKISASFSAPSAGVEVLNQDGLWGNVGDGGGQWSSCTNSLTFFFKKLRKIVV